MVFVFDLDGTLSFAGKKVDTEIEQALLRLMKRGHKVVFASARPIRDILPILNDEFHSFPMIGGNGSIVSLNAEIIANSKIEKDTYKAILDIFKREKCGILVDDIWNYSYIKHGNDEIRKKVDQNNVAKNVSLEEIESPIKVVLINAQSIEKLIYEIKTLGLSVNQYKKENIIDITNSGINKYSGLKTFGIEKKQYIVFGNDDNDIELFENCYFSIQIGSHASLDQLSNHKIEISENITNQIVEMIDCLGIKYE